MNRKEREKERLKNYPCLEIDPLETAGVLLSDEIEYYVKEYKLIDPFNIDNLKPAAYKLTIGDEYAKGGNIKKLYDEPGKNEIRIPPFEVVVLKTEEIINLPRFLIARWNIEVKWAYEGLLWVGGPQVDPGWVGFLPCPIYNLSNKEVVLRSGETIAIIDFVKTTPFKKEACLEYSHPPERIIFDDYNPEKLKSALYTQAKERIDDIENNVNRFGSRLDTSVGIIFMAIAVLVAALAIFVSSGQGVHETLPWWTYLCVVFSIIALGISIFAYTKARSKDALSDDVERRIKKLECCIKILVIAIIALTVTIILIALGKN